MVDLRSVIESIFKNDEIASLVELNDAVVRDSLTNVYNRRCLENFEEKIFDPIGHHNNLGIVFVDINDFGKINKKHGHQAGDESIKEIASCLEYIFRKNEDLIIRYGGDEFLIICQNIKDSTKFESDITERLDALNENRIKLKHSKLSTPMPTIAFGLLLTIKR